MFPQFIENNTRELMPEAKEVELASRREKTERRLGFQRNWGIESANTEVHSAQ
jgi:hypothetical protein